MQSCIIFLLVKSILYIRLQEFMSYKNTQMIKVASETKLGHHMNQNNAADKEILISKEEECQLLILPFFT